MAPLFRVLGPLEVEGAGALGGPRPRALLRTLLASPDAVVPADRLIDAVWGERPPETARHALQVYLSQLRKAIPDGADRIRTEPEGYRIVVADDELDAALFERGARQGQSLLAAHRPAAAAQALTQALSLWRGTVEATDAGDAYAARLEELRLAALEHRIAADLELGRHAEVVPELERLVGEHPLRERLRQQLMLALYRCGRQADALAVYARTRRMLVDELGLEPGPELRELEAAILRQDPALAGRSAAPRRGVRLPAAAAPLVGRRAEIEELRSLVVGDARLVTITGPGGIGKTRVALQVLAEVADDFDDGAVFVDLAALREPALVGAEIAAALGIEPGARTNEQALADHLEERDVLLALDNFEQVDEAASLLSALLAGAARLKLLVTSRRRLRIYGEYEFALPPLRLRDEAIPLFVARAHAAGARLEPTDEVARMCSALDCLPLAIELTAARAGRVSAAEMLERLPARLGLAADGPRDAPPRHRALQATIAWSHDLLDERLRALFEALSVFAGGWDADAAQAVTGAAPHELESLVSHSLVRAEGDRFALLETIREYAAAALTAGGAAGRVQDEHAAYFLRYARHAARELRGGGDQAAWLDRLEREHDNMRAALSRFGDTDAAGELALVGALSPFWAVRGHAAEGLQRLTRALERAGAGETVEHADALAGASLMAWIRGDHERSRTLAEQALARFRALDHAPGTVRALASLGYVALQAGEVDTARVLYEECLEVARADDNARSVSVALNCLVELALGSRDLERAREVGEESLSLAREISDQESIAVASLNLGYVAVHQDRTHDAAAHLREAARLFARLGDHEVTAHALNGLAAVSADRPAVAARVLGAAEALRDSVAGAQEFEPDVRARALETVRAQLGDERFEAEYEQGRALGLDELLSGL